VALIDAVTTAHCGSKSLTSTRFAAAAAVVANCLQILLMETC